MFFISKNDIEATQEFRAGFVIIDVLSKYAVVVPIKSKNPADVIAGTMEGLEKMRAKPKIIYTDDEGSINGLSFWLFCFFWFFEVLGTSPKGPTGPKTMKRDMCN